jgi:hypothetical protein
MGIILSLVLGALVQEIVKLLIQWWMDHRGEMRGMVRECGNDDEELRAGAVDIFFKIADRFGAPSW